MTDSSRRSLRVDPSTAHRIVAAALESPVMPVDFLVRELRQTADAAEWIAQALHTVANADLPLPHPDFEGHGAACALHGSVRDALLACSVPSLNRLRKRAIVLYDTATEIHERNGCLAVYILAVATGLSQHGVLLSHHARRDIDLMCAELVAAVPPDIGEIVDRALAAATPTAQTHL